ncbi:CTD small phosphatase-like protein 2 [Coemansia sp. RSA 1286]|nr:CTD small phosphatase-like protein 2 [Coemansia sp. RSA 1721]KAJ2637712.1 CTD small phosphatase-like protein 2 [Coemansia sp. RSA 1286]
MARHRSSSIKPKTKPAPPKRCSTAKRNAANSNATTATGSELRRSRRNAGMPVEHEELASKAKDAPKHTDRVIAKPKSRVAAAAAAINKATANDASATKTRTATRQQKVTAKPTTTNGTATTKASVTTTTPNNKNLEDSSESPKSETAAPSANFIMSSPKRKTRDPAPRTGSPAQLPASSDDTNMAAKRRKPNEDTEAAIDIAIHEPESPGFHSPLQRRLRPANAQPADDSSAADTPVQTPSKISSLWAKRTADSLSDASPSPLKSILTPVLDLLRRVSGIAQDPLGLQRQLSTVSLKNSDVAVDSKEDQQSTQSTDIVDDDMANATGASSGCPEADSLTAPPMNPTTLSAGVPTLPTFLPTMNGSGIQLYLSDSPELDTSCNASQITTGYPETPSKENIPVYNTSQLQDYDFDSSASHAALLTASSIPGTSLQPPPLPQHQQQSTLQQQPQIPNGITAGELATDSELDLSQISSISDSEIDTNYEQYLQYEDEDEEFNPYLFMADLPPVPEEHTLRPPALPLKTRSTPPITLVLDLDETLVHCALTKVDNADLVFPVEYNGINYDVYCRLRPGYREFLEKASKLFEVVVFTASQQVYADRLLNLIDPERRYIKHRLFRDSCVYVNTNYVKDLGILGRDESKMILVDNCPQAFAYQQSNGIPIESWYEDKGDRELMRLMEFLETLVGDDDVRPKVEAQFRTKEKVAEAKKRYQLKMGVPYGSPIWARANKP